VLFKELLFDTLVKKIVGRAATKRNKNSLHSKTKNYKVKKKNEKKIMKNQFCDKRKKT